MMGRQSTPGGVALRPCPAVPCSSSSLAHNPSAQLRPLQCMCTCTMPQSKWSARMRTPPDVHAMTPAAPSPSSKVFLICSVTHVSTRCLRLAWPTVLYTIHASMQLADGFGVWTLCTRHAGIVGPRERACTWAVLSRRCPRQPHRSNRST